MTSPNTNAYRIIIIDDTESIHEDFRKTLGGRSAESAAAAESLSRQEAMLFGDQTADDQLTAYEIDSALQGEEGRELVRRAVNEGRPYAVAFVDMRMPPGWDGLQTIEHLWREDPSLQVVICTAYSDYSWKEIIGRLGVSDKLLILKKPFENVEVSQIAMALCEKWAMTRTAKLKLSELEELVERRTSELRYAATHDRLTGLANRDFLITQLRKVLNRPDRSAAYALLCIDFDRFKMVNDSLGHDMGDLLLQLITQRIEQTLTDVPGALAARMGGDEFIVLLSELRGPRDAVAVAGRLLTALHVPYDLKGHEVCSTASIGITTSEMDYCQPQDVLRHADLAMYRAKSNGRNCCAMFDRTMHDEIVSRMQMEQLLRHAIAEGMLCAYYQPIVRVSDGQIIGMEALCRMRYSDKDVIAPADFIPIAEEVGLINDVGDFMLRAALLQLKQWQQMGNTFADLSIAVNVSRQQLIDSAIVNRVKQLLAETHVKPECLLLEITESSIMAAPEVFAERLGELKELGVRFAMDDFGTGQSSLTCLHRFPIDVLKIDRSFIHSVSHNLEYAAIVQAIITLAGNLKMQVIAEGIETNPQLVLIQALDCAAAQGFLFAEPRDAEYWNQNLASLNRSYAQHHSDPSASAA